MLRRHDLEFHELAFRHRHAGLAEDGLGFLLVHGKRRGEHAGMRIGNLQCLKHGGTAAILAPLAVQGVEGHVRPQVLQDGHDALARHVDGDHIEAGTAAARRRRPRPTTG